MNRTTFVQVFYVLLFMGKRVVFCVCAHEVGGKTLIQPSALSIIRRGPECPDWIGRVLWKVGKSAVVLATVLLAVIGTELALVRLVLRRVKCRSVR